MFGVLPSFGWMAPRKKGKLFAWASIYEEETVGKRMRYRVRDDMVKNEKFPA